MYIMTEIRRLAFLFLTVCLVASCSKYKKVMKEPDYGAKEKLAMELYQKKKYSRALPLFEELITIYRGTRKAEDYYYYYAYCNFGVGDFLLANYWFEYFVGTYPFSPRVEECRYMAAYCFYKDSPREPLEQTNTIKAIRELQSFIDSYPQSPKVADCNALIDELRKKLENKDYRIAVQYFNMEYYTASIVSFENILKDYPETERRPEASYMIVKASYQYATLSVRAKKKERLQAAKAYYEKYCQKSGTASENKYLRDAASISEKINRELAAIEAEEAAMRKIENSVYESAVTLYNSKNYKEALSSFQHLLREFPRTEHITHVSWYMISGSYELAGMTPESKKKVKLVDAKNNYTKFAHYLKGTSYEKDADAILTGIENELARLERRNSN